MFSHQRESLFSRKMVDRERSKMTRKDKKSTGNSKVSLAQCYEAVHKANRPSTPMAPARPAPNMAVGIVGNAAPPVEEEVVAAAAPVEEALAAPEVDPPPPAANPEVVEMVTVDLAVAEVLRFEAAVPLIRPGT